MGVLHESWSHSSTLSHYDAEMLWSACCTPPDILVDSRDNPTMVSVHLCHSKTDPFGAGVTIYLGRTYQPVCPVSALLAYLARRGHSHDLLFLFQDGSTLSRQKLVFHVRQVLDKQCIDSSGYTRHSYRIGAATTAALVGLDDSDSGPLAIGSIPQIHSKSSDGFGCHILPLVPKFRPALMMYPLIV